MSDKFYFSGTASQFNEIVEKFATEKPEPVEDFFLYTITVSRSGPEKQEELDLKDTKKK